MAKRDPKRLDALLAIAKMIAPRMSSAEITQAFDDPAAYVAAHAAQLSERGIDRPQRDLPWIALVDALADARALVEIDWKTEADDVAASVRTLAKGFRLPKGDDERSTWELLEEAGVALRATGMQLAQLDMGSDAYPLVVVPVRAFAKLAELAKRAGFGKARAFGDQLEKAREDRLESQRPPGEQTGRQILARGDETWSIETFASAEGMNARYEARFASPAGGYFELHYFPGDAGMKTAASARIAAWQADGFRATRKAPAARAASAWIAPLPDDGRYFTEGKRKISCLVQRGDAVWVTEGVPPRSFGAEQIFHHARSENAAARDLEQRIEDYTTSGYFDAKPIDRAEAVARYEKKSKRR